MNLLSMRFLQGILLDKVVIPESVTAIEYGALNGCSRVILPDIEFALSLDALGI